MRVHNSHLSINSVFIDVKRQLYLKDSHFNLNCKKFLLQIKQLAFMCSEL